jgi:hypothetical protein
MVTGRNCLRGCEPDLPGIILISIHLLIPPLSLFSFSPRAARIIKQSRIPLIHRRRSVTSLRLTKLGDLLPSEALQPAF